MARAGIIAPQAAKATYLRSSPRRLAPKFFQRFTGICKRAGTRFLRLCRMTQANRRDGSGGLRSAQEEKSWNPPTEEEIRRRAYELYLERVRECGGALDDWLEAEAELLLRRRDGDRPEVE